MRNGAVRGRGSSVSPALDMTYEPICSNAFCPSRRMPHPFYFLGNNLLFSVDRLRRSLVSGWGNEAIDGRFMANPRKRA